MFFPYVGLTLSVSWALYLLFLKFIERNDQYKKLLWVPVLLLFIACAYGTYKRNNVWHSEESLWRNVTLKSPGNGRGLMNYGLIMVEEGKYDVAQKYFDKALQLLPEYSFIYANIAVLKQKTGDYPTAEKYFLNAITLGPNYPVNYELYGEFLYDMKRYHEAETALEKSLSLSRAALNTRIYLMKTFEALGEWGNLKLLASDTLQILPDNTDAAEFLEDAQKQKNKADVEAEKVKQAPTAEKYLQLSLDYYMDRRYDLCIDAAQAGIILKPNFAAAYNNIGSAYIALKQFDKAAEALKKAISLSPGYVLAKKQPGACRKS